MPTFKKEDIDWDIDWIDSRVTREPRTWNEQETRYSWNRPVNYFWRVWCHYCQFEEHQERYKIPNYINDQLKQIEERVSTIEGDRYDSMALLDASQQYSE